MLNYPELLTDLTEIYDEIDSLVDEMNAVVERVKTLKKAIDIFAADKPSLFVRQANQKADVKGLLDELMTYYKKDIGAKGQRLNVLRHSVAANAASRELPTTLQYNIALKFITEDCKARGVTVVEAVGEYEKRIAEIRRTGADKELISAIDEELRIMEKRNSFLTRKIEGK